MSQDSEVAHGAATLREFSVTEGQVYDYLHYKAPLHALAEVDSDNLMAALKIAGWLRKVGAKPGLVLRANAIDFGQPGWLIVLGNYFVYPQFHGTDDRMHPQMLAWRISCPVGCDQRNESTDGLVLPDYLIIHYEEKLKYRPSTSVYEAEYLMAIEGGGHTYSESRDRGKIQDEEGYSKTEFVTPPFDEEDEFPNDPAWEGAELTLTRKTLFISWVANL